MVYASIKRRRIDTGADRLAAERGKQNSRALSIYPLVHLYSCVYPSILSIHLSVPLPLHRFRSRTAHLVLSSSMRFAVAAYHPRACALSRAKTSPRFALSPSLSLSRLALSCTSSPLFRPHPSVSLLRARILPLYVPPFHPSSLQPPFSPARTRVNTCERASDGRERARMTYAERISLLYILRAAVRRNLRRCRRHSSTYLHPPYLLPRVVSSSVSPPPHRSVFRLFSRSSPLLISVASSLASGASTDLCPSSLPCILFVGVFASVCRPLALCRRLCRHWLPLASHSENISSLSTLIFDAVGILLLFLFSS